MPTDHDRDRTRVALALLLLLALAAPSPARDLLVRNGRVWGEPEGATAVLCREGRIVALGADAALASRAAPDARIVDAQGGLIVPGFHDAHAHVLMGGEAMGALDLEGCATIAEVQSAVRAWAGRGPTPEWIVGRGWSYDLAPGGRMPTRRELDRACADRPVVLESYDGHTVWANSRALALAGVTADTRDPEDGQIAREADGRTPAGALLEGAQGLVWSHVPGSTPAQRRRALLAALDRYLDLGVTSVDAIVGDPAEVELWRALARDGRLEVRATLSPPLETDPDEAARLRDALAADRAAAWLRLGFLKGFLDGVIESRTAYMLEPYSGAAPGDGAPGRGAPLIPPEELHRRVAAAHARGLPVGLHAIGDAAVRLALDAFAAAAEAHPDRRVRHRIEHIEVVHRDDLARFRALDVVASMQPFHARPSSAPSDADVWSRNLGPERLARAFAWRALLDQGAPLAFGSDWPVMTQDPLRGLAVAITRRDEEGLPAAGWHPEQALTAGEAVAAYTRGSAYAVGREAELGCFAPGQLADLVVLDPAVDLARPATLWTGRVSIVVTGGVVRRPRRA